MAPYQVAMLGNPDERLRDSILEKLRGATEEFGLAWAEDVVVKDVGSEFRPGERSVSVVVVFGADELGGLDVVPFYDTKRIPAIPVASTEKRVDREIPAALRAFNCLFLDVDGPDRICGAILAALGLLPEQRRVFLSYRREESTSAAIQLFAALYERQHQVFLDTHCINAGAKFQESLWHQLCDADVLIMLETDGYFDSRWTAAEYGRALSKGIGVLRVTWPDSTPNPFTGTASRVELLPGELHANGTLDAAAVNRILDQLERVRVTSHAVRHRSLMDGLCAAVSQIDCVVSAVGPDRTVDVELRSGRRVLVQPVLGVPTSVTLHRAVERASSADAAIVYDHLGIRPSWMDHMGWLVGNRQGVRWVKASEAGWDLAGWETQ